MAISSSLYFLSNLTGTKLPEAKISYEDSEILEDIFKLLQIPMSAYETIVAFDEASGYSASTQVIFLYPVFSNNNEHEEALTRMIETIESGHIPPPFRAKLDRKINISL
ncbi:hypothetical protein BCU83_18475 [Vibrio breoganii]|nr:hypothetical protein BCU83_18475 [Vibrio breoganii]